MTQVVSENLRNNRGILVANLLHFGRMLRASGIPVSSQQIYELGEGIAQIDLSRKDDFYCTSRAFLLHDIEKIRLFNIVFDLFWSHQIKAMLEFFIGHQSSDFQSKEIIDSQSENLITQSDIDPSIDSINEEKDDPNRDEAKINPMYSSMEVLYQKDFSKYNEAELLEAKKLIKKLVWQVDHQWTRRRIRSTKKSHFLDFRRSIRNNMLNGGELLDLEWQRRKLRPRSLVFLFDISGSMEIYSKILLQFLYSLVQNIRRVEAFAFATRLTRITPALRKDDIEIVLNTLSVLIYDWSGGTRIGESLKTFNFRWARRILSRGAIVVIISDGWDRGDIGLLELEISRLKRSASRLIWLNPVAGSPDYEPLVRGIQTVMPFVDDFYPLHNLQSLDVLAKRLGSLGFN